ELLRDNGVADELAAAEAITGFFKSAELADLIKLNGFDKKHVVADEPCQGGDLEGGPARSATAPEQAAVDNFWEEVKARGFKFAASTRGGNKLAPQFDRQKRSDPKLAKGYASCGKDPEAQAALRADWAKGRYDKYQKDKMKVVTLTKKTFTKGVYAPTGRIAHKEGGGKLGWLQ
ncbi:unnamed protein product, partial [Prorocentrum cordatum]